MSHDIFGTRIIAAPMAGGTSTPDFVKAVHDAGGLGFLAAGYKGVAAMQAEIRSARAAGARFGMNVFVPDPAQLPPSAAVRAQLEEYRARLRPDARAVRRGGPAVAARRRRPLARQDRRPAG